MQNKHRTSERTLRHGAYGAAVEGEQAGWSGRQRGGVVLAEEMHGPYMGSKGRRKGRPCVLQSWPRVGLMSRVPGRDGPGVDARSGGHVERRTPSTVATVETLTNKVPVSRRRSMHPLRVVTNKEHSCTRQQQQLQLHLLPGGPITPQCRKPRHACPIADTDANRNQGAMCRWLAEKCAAPLSK